MGRAWVITLSPAPDGWLEAGTNGHFDTIREAVEESANHLKGDADMVATIVIEEAPHVTRLFDGTDHVQETRYRLLAQSWRRADGHIDQRVSLASETPWGSVA